MFATWRDALVAITRWVIATVFVLVALAITSAAIAVPLLFLIGVLP